MFSRELEVASFKAMIFTLVLGISGCVQAAPATSLAQGGQRTTTYAPVITRDAWGIPTITGATDADVSYGLALAHAQDDFLTIQRVILASRGRLGTVEGIEGAKSDFLWHVLKVQETIDQAYERDLSPQTRALLDGYAAGLNAYRANHPREGLRGAEAVTGRDIAAGFVLTSPLFWGFDRFLGKLVEGKEQVCLTQPQSVTVPERGSNAFAIAPSRSSDGHTRLLLNSHQPWSGPVAWYEARVESAQGWKFRGALFPGSPTPLIGHNDNLGWATTVNQPDLADLYRLTTDQAHPNQYLLNGQWRAFEVRKITLRVKIGPVIVPVPRTIRFSVHGPAFETPEGWVAVRYSGANDVRVVEQYYRMTRARDFEEWRAATAMHAIPSTNLMYADRTGRIGLFYNASLPQRPAGQTWRGCVAGDRSDLIWSQGTLAAMPELVLPSSGWLYSANGTPFSATDPAADLSPEPFLAAGGVEMNITNRGYRAIELLTPRTKISREDLLATKFDVTYSRRSSMARFIGEVLATTDPRLTNVRAVLGRWNLSATGDSREAALALLAYAPFRRAERLGNPSPDLIASMLEAQATLIRATGRIDPALSDVLRLRRGAVDLPLQGGPDLLRAIGWTLDKDSKMRADFGDGFIMLVDWAPDGTLNENAIHQYGAATSVATSAHYSDQTTAFAKGHFRGH